MGRQDRAGWGHDDGQIDSLGHAEDSHLGAGNGLESHEWDQAKD